ncbi:MAG: hypothetical protein RLY21_1494 [Planctomycetota bacterium]|jgi:formylglycine-generating enzyme required for sulfatase activity/TPR repeat protein
MHRAELSIGRAVAACIVSLATIATPHAAASGWRDVVAASQQATDKYASTLERALAALERGDAAAAEKLGFSLTVVDETRWEGFAILGSAYGRQGKSDEADEAFAKAKSLAPASEHAAIDDLARESVPGGSDAPARDRRDEEAPKVEPRDGDAPKVAKPPARRVGRTSDADLSKASRRQWDALKLIAKDFENTVDPIERTKFGFEFLGKALPLLEAEPDFIPAWTLYAVVSIEVDAPDSGWIAGGRMRLLGLEDSDEAAMRELFAQLERKGWLDAENFEDRNWSKWNIKQLEAAAAAGDLRARERMGFWKLNGTAPYEKNVEEGLAILRGAVDAGSVKAMESLSQAIVGSNLDEACRLKGRLARLGWIWAGNWLRKQARGEEAARNEYVAYLELANRLGHLGATLDLADACKGEFGCEIDPKRAFDLTRQAAECGVVDAMRSLGDLYAIGFGVPRDYASARSWFQRAADAGSTTAAARLGAMLLNGFGGPADVTTAVRMLEQGANAGDARSAYLLAEIYNNGSQEVPQDLFLAREWALRASSAGDTDGALLAAQLLRSGCGGAVDEAEAERLLRGSMQRDPRCALALALGLLSYQPGEAPVDVAAPSRFAALPSRQLEGLGILGGLLQGNERTDDLIERERVASRNLTEIMLAAVQAFGAADPSAFDKRIPDALAMLDKFRSSNNQVQFDVALTRAILALRTSDIDNGWKAMTEVHRSLKEFGFSADAASLATFPAGPRKLALERLIAAKWSGSPSDEAPARALVVAARRAGPTKELADNGYTVEAYEPDPAVVTDAVTRAKILATGLPWKIRHQKSGIVLLLVPAGGFLMGSKSEDRAAAVRSGTWLDAASRAKMTAILNTWEAQHSRKISKPFYLSQLEVSQAEWRAVMGSSPSQFAGDANPVEQVSWFAADGFVKKAAGMLRLPSEAEWEFACRTGQEGPYSFGATITTAQVNFDGSKPLSGTAVGENRKKTVPCGSLPANRWGFHEMHGNVFEWVSDELLEYPKDAEADEKPRTGGEGTRVLRGGSWFADPLDCRSAARQQAQPAAANASWGFRVARDAGALMIGAKAGSPVAADGSALATALPGVRAPTALATTSTGLQWVDIEMGSGASPRDRQSEVVVHYTGYLMDGTKFDSSFDKGQPATLPLDGVIAGWAEGVLSMRAGGKRKLVIPPELAYGEAGRGPIPASATLVFDIELIEVKD